MNTLPDFTASTAAEYLADGNTFAKVAKGFKALEDTLGVLATNDILSSIEIQRTTELSSDYIGKRINVKATSPITVTLPEIKNTHPSNVLLLRNLGTETVTVKGAATDTLGWTPATLETGESVLLDADIAGNDKTWHVLLRGGQHVTGRYLLKAFDASKDKGETVEIELAPGYLNYELDFSTVRTDNKDGQYFMMQISPDGGKTWQTSDYALGIYQTGSNDVPNSIQDAKNAHAITLQGGQSSMSTTAVSGRIYMFEPAQTDTGHHFMMDTVAALNNGDNARSEGGCVASSAGNKPYNRIRLFFGDRETGAIAGKVVRGQFRLYGIS
ncbi:hypothetical protein [Paraburkholderia caffeinilytica]|uniref:hypothetical protein n=1 Tax=Paraburkholderia caffeinilytica TaxID=1761016 RepID=UPI003D9FEA3D